jgi:ABC-type nickel/cobalt efflux system permease component RcnA
MSARRPCIAAVAAAVLIVVLAGSAGTAAAHPLGNYTVNSYRGLTVAPDGIAIDYVVDLAEIPTFQEREAVAAAGSTDRYASERCAEAAGRMELSLDGRRLAVNAVTSRVTFPGGQGGLATTRIECLLTTPVGLRVEGATLQFTDGNAVDRIGWREITVQGVGVRVDAEVPSRSSSDRLTAYPSGTAAGAVPRIDAVSAGLVVTDPARHLPRSAALIPLAETARGRDPLAALIGRADQGWWPMLAALGVAAMLGALHGLAPGHGKSVVAAYLVGTRGTRRQAGALAATVALSHTSGVFLLGGATLVASATFPLERIYGWLQLGSAVIVIGLGLWLARQLWMSRRTGAGAHHGHGPAGHHHAHGYGAELHPDALRGQAPEHDHTHRPGDHGDGHGHGDDHGHGDHHGHPHVAHGHDAHGHDAGAGHDHGHGDHGHDAGAGLHRHGLLPHRHRVAWEAVDLSAPLHWRALFVLGLSGGLLPSASAVIVLLGAVQLGRIGFGAALILAFGVGLAAALVGVGLGAVAISRRAGTAIRSDVWRDRTHRWTAPVACVALLTVGAYLTSRALLVL